MEEAQASHVYSYGNGFRGFAARLTEKQASEMAGIFFQNASPVSVCLITEIALFWLWVFYFPIMWFPSEMPGVVSVFPNSKRTLHTTHSWDFLGLSTDASTEIPGFSTENQENVIIGFIDTGEYGHVLTCHHLQRLYRMKLVFQFSLKSRETYHVSSWLGPPESGKLPVCLYGDNSFIP